MLIVTPLFNSRVLPQFNHQRFNHGVAPLVDQERGFSTVFTLNLRPTIFTTLKTEDENKAYVCYDFDGRGNFDHNSNTMYGHYYNISPGLLIKYFNGIELKIPLTETIIRVDRFVISKDGHHIVIVCMVPEVSPNNKNVIVLRDCLLIYKVSKEDYRSIELVDKIYFADKFTPTVFEGGEEEEIDEQDILKDSEVNELVVGEYHQEYYDTEYLYFPEILGNIRGFDNDEERIESEREVLEASKSMPNQKFFDKTHTIPMFELISARAALHNGYDT